MRKELNRVNGNSKIIPEDTLPAIYIGRDKGVEKSTRPDKEATRFNKLIRELLAEDEIGKQQQLMKDEYDKLFITRVVPKLKQLAAAELKFAQHIEAIFYKERTTKSLQRMFVQFILDFLDDAGHYNDEAKTMLNVYLEKLHSFLSKKERASVAAEFEESGYYNPFTDFKPGGAFDEEMFKKDFEAYAEEMHRERREAKSMKKPDPLSIVDLYKGLAKMLHPDLEQDENLRAQKEDLMKELVVARNDADVYAMLLLKQKAHQLNNSLPGENDFSPEKLKAYNKYLKQKLDEKRRSHNKEMLSHELRPDGFPDFYHHSRPAAIQVKAHLKHIESQKSKLKHNAKYISALADIEELIGLYN